MPAGTDAMPNRTLALATLIAWVFTASVGAFMLRSVVISGELRKQRGRQEGLPPVVLFAHFSLALTGLVVWISYLAVNWIALAWVAVCLLAPAIGLGLSTVTLWTPFPDFPVDPATGHPAAGHTGFPSGVLASPAENALGHKLTDQQLVSATEDEVLMARLVEEVLASIRADPAKQPRKPKRPREHLAALIPVGHGMGAVVTVLLAVVTAAIGS